ncbi:permeases of the major facilitator superfamily [Stylonychia lemnae]|uniref:Permeases of the major facilitator superfamily n=1 Tax=Stylonychia lemnae TaxID=5949 RepID=A0A078AB62_STYLE|nr:permeases of the major facilitator superfamily [Stylonychia lemnae]|eukprot:CDW78847.1 permeases of the major facilitator superfamily [Stylonychia lemnae]
MTQKDTLTDIKENINASSSDRLITLSEQKSVIQPVVPKPTKYAYFVLGILLLIYISNQWQRSGYNLKPEADDPYYNINFIPSFTDNYGYLAGASFTIPISIVGIFMGALSDIVNRKVMLAFACILWSLMTFLQGFCEAFWQLCVCRIFLGIFQAACNPPAYSIMADYFHPQYRTTANSIYSLGIYLGGALSSLSIVMITGVGWRWMFRIIGIIGIGAGVLGLFLVREPLRGAFDTSKKSTLVPEKKVKPSPLILFLRASKEIFVNPTCRWVCIAGSFRFFGGYAIGYYMPSYFGKVYPDESTLYSVLNSFVVSVGGFISAMSGGIIADRYEARFPMIKAWVCIAGSILGCPTIAVCTLYQKNFGVSMFFLFLEYLFAECWTSSAITMLINTISPENKGFGNIFLHQTFDLAVSAYLFFTTLAGTLSTFLLGQFESIYELKTHPERYGYILCAFVFFSYLGAVPWFIMSGFSYRTHLKKKEEEALNQQ